MQTLYSTLRWRATAARIRKRDGNRCFVARLVGGECAHGTFHVHHIRPVEEGGAPFDDENLATVCASHHPFWEALRRRLLAALEPDLEDRPPVCRHFHRTREAREQCEARMARRQRDRAVAA